MEELARLEAERGTAGYGPTESIATSGGTEVVAGRAKRSAMGGIALEGNSVGKERGKRERVASNEMCTFLILNISSLQLIPVNMIAYE